MNIRVEGTDDYGNSVYGELFERILIDLGLSNRVEQARMIIRPEAPLFLISVRTRKGRTTVSVSEIASIEDKDPGTFLTITNESYAPSLLALLWKRFGQERIEQLSRLEVLCKGVPRAEIEALTLDPGQELKKEVIDAVWRLLPEGFKVRHNILSDTVLTIAATEHTMQKEFIELAEKVHGEMEASTSEELEAGTEVERAPEKEPVENEEEDG